MNPRQGNGLSTHNADFEQLITPIPSLGLPFSYMPTSFASPNIIPHHPDIIDRAFRNVAPNNLAKLKAFQEELICINFRLYSLRDTQISFNLISTAFCRVRTKRTLRTTRTMAPRPAESLLLQDPQTNEHFYTYIALYIIKHYLLPFPLFLLFFFTFFFISFIFFTFFLMYTFSFLLLYFSYFCVFLSFIFF
jgi:hypothetical protein